MIREDSWDLISEIPSTQLLQPTPKACPLPRPAFPIQPRLASALHVSTARSSGDPSVRPSGPRLTVAGLSTATPALASGYDPVRSPLSHHVSRIACPYARMERTDYYPVSLQMRSSSNPNSETSLLQSSVPALCPSTAAALPCPPLDKGTKHKGDKSYPVVRPSTGIQLTRSKLTSDNSFLVAQFAELLAFFGNSSEVYMSLRDSSFADEHRKRLLNNYAATTVFRYLQAVFRNLCGSRLN